MEIKELWNGCAANGPIFACAGEEENYQLLGEYGNVPLFALIEMEILMEMGTAL